MRQRNKGWFLAADNWNRPPATLSRAAALRALGHVVYAVRVDDVIKIGCTGDLARRCRELHASDVLAFMPGTVDVERALHDRLVEHRHHGVEWYYPTPGVMAVVNEMREVIGLDPVA